MSTNFLARAVNEVLSLTESGTLPRTAIVKVAAAQSLLPDQIDRLCQLFNRTASIGERVGADDLVTKLSSVNVVDPALVKKDLAELQEGRSAAASAAKVASMPMVEKLLSTPTAAIPVAKKVAAAPVAPTKDPSHGLYHGLDLEAAHRELEHIDQRYQVAQRKVASLVMNYQIARGCASEELRKKTASMGESFLQQFRFVASQHPQLSDAAQEAVGWATQFLPTHKQASFGQVEQLPTALSQESHHAVELFAKSAAAAKELYEQLPGLGAESARCRELAYIIKTCLVDGGVKNAALVVGSQSLADQQAEHVEKVANVTSMFLTSQLANLSKPAEDKKAPGSSDEDRFMVQLGAPQHEANLSAIRSRTALQQLMVDDPVISTTPEHEVLGAYNEVANYAPRALENPATMRSVLRQYLQNNASAMDLAAIRKLERDSKPERNEV